MRILIPVSKYAWNKAKQLINSSLDRVALRVKMLSTRMNNYPLYT